MVDRTIQIPQELANFNVNTNINGFNVEIDFDPFRRVLVDLYSQIQALQERIEELESE